MGDFCRSRPSKSNKSLRKCVFLFVWVFFARYRKESCEWLIFEHLLSFQSSWLLLKVPQVTPPWHVPMPEWNIVGGSRLHHLANCLLAATSHWRILATSLEEGLTQAKLQFHLVISEERVCVCLCPCVCVRVCVCWLAGIMDECCRNECAGSVLQGRSISTIHSSLITTAELRRDLFLFPSRPLVLFHNLYLVLFFSAFY